MIKRILITIALSFTLLSAAKSAADPAYTVNSFVASHPEIENALSSPETFSNWINDNRASIDQLLSNTVVQTLTITQIPLLRNNQILTIWNLSTIDSNATYTPSWPGGYFDNSAYAWQKDSSSSANDSVYISTLVTENGTGGSDSVRIIRIGAFDANTALTTGPYQIDTLNTAGNNLYQQKKGFGGVKNTIRFPYASFLVKGILCQGPRVLVFVWNPFTK